MTPPRPFRSSPSPHPGRPRRHRRRLHRHRQDRSVPAAHAVHARAHEGPRPLPRVRRQPHARLAQQISRTCMQISRKTGHFVTTVYGGTPYGPQIPRAARRHRRAHRHSGRLNDLMDRGVVDLSRPRCSCSTRPTACLTWASCPTSPRSWSTRRPNARRCCSPRPSTAPSRRIWATC